MYICQIKKTLPENYTLDDIQMLTAIATNEEQVHCMLGRLFGVNGQKNWRANNSIVYKKLEDTCTYLVQSAIPIDKNAAKKESVTVIQLKEETFYEGQELTIHITLSTFKQNNTKNRVAIKTSNERKDWVCRKLQLDNKDTCEILSFEETAPCAFFMSHLTEKKGSEMLAGHNYRLTIKLTDPKAFQNIYQKGIGPCKNYGFGLIEIV